ncbi:CENPB protein [Geosmithia morbida]|uniref:CENPB protein n=1 Tax=Geosmithia morbida TaxID=1094350 RepID=A0A9P5D7C6_9HYPO|nr:CENPB protein [Geosmithia morbida]KAF4126496.1 CENPB protein [Geosmithia morbida]
MADATTSTTDPALTGPSSPGPNPSAANNNHNSHGDGDGEDAEGTSELPAAAAGVSSSSPPADGGDTTMADTTTGGEDGTGAGESNAKERNSLTLEKRRHLRLWAFGQAVRPSHRACIDWFYGQYGQHISQSTVSHSLSPKYARLDDSSQLSGSRLRLGNWPDVEKLVLRWYQQGLATGRQPTNDELGDKAKAIFKQLPRYKDENPPEFSPGWIHRFKRRYGLLARRQRRPSENPAEDVRYLAEYVPRFMDITPDTSLPSIREQVLRVIGVDPSLHICALVRDEVIRRLSNPGGNGTGNGEGVTTATTAAAAAAPPMSPPPIIPAIPAHPDQPLYADDDPEVVLQNALRQLQQEEQAAEEQAAAVREERDNTDTAGLAQQAMIATPNGRANSDPRYATPAHEMGPDLTLTPIHSEGPLASSERPIRCPFCVNQRMLRSIKESVEHMSTHVVV